MKINQLLVNTAIVVILGVVFYGTSMLISNFTAGRQDTFSQDRQMAERFLEEQNWLDASPHLIRLTEADPYNGYAFYSLAVSYYNLRRNVKQQISQLHEEQTDEIDLDLLVTLEENFRNFDNLCLDAFEKSTGFLRYRRLALLNLALLRVEREEWLPAIDYLEQFVSEGYFTNRGLDSFQSLGRGGEQVIDDETIPESETKLHRFAKFWEVIDKEKELRGSNYSLPQLPPRRGS